VERLCSHVAIIHQGRLVANGSLDELRAGVAAPITADGSAEPARWGTAREKLTLEEIFLRIVGGGSAESTEEALQELSWLA